MQRCIVLHRIIMQSEVLLIHCFGIRNAAMLFYAYTTLTLSVVTLTCVITVSLES